VTANGFDAAPTVPAVSHLGHVHLKIRDLEESVGFYTASSTSR